MLYFSSGKKTRYKVKVNIIAYIHRSTFYICTFREPERGGTFHMKEGGIFIGTVLFYEFSNSFQGFN